MEKEGRRTQEGLKRKENRSGKRMCLDLGGLKKKEDRSGKNEWGRTQEGLKRKGIAVGKNKWGRT